MQTCLKIGALGAIAFAAILSAGSAQAQSPCWPNYGYWPYPGYGYSSANTEYVPYFALHPPVYYSMPIPRTFGYSPFAYPPGTMTPELAPTAPAEIINPYVPQTPTPKPEKKPAVNKPVAMQPKVVMNPYVTPDASIATRDAAK